jgi:hypothetical protein
MEKTLTQSDLEQFTGTEHYYKHALSGAVYTDGVQYMAEKAGAYWLLDKILITTKHFEDKKIKAKMVEFGVWTLHKNPDNSALLECGDGNGNSLYKEEIEWTDFPMSKITLWSINGVLILPSEY